MIFAEKSIEQLLNMDPTGHLLCAHVVKEVMEPKVVYPLNPELTHELELFLEAIKPLPEATCNFRTHIHFYDFMASIEKGRLFQTRESLPYNVKLNFLVMKLNPQESSTSPIVIAYQRSNEEYEKKIAATHKTPSQSINQEYLIMSAGPQRNPPEQKNGVFSCFKF